MLRGVVVWCGVLAVWLLCSPAQPAHAAASPSYVAMFSDGDWVGGGVQRLFHSGNASISISGTPGYLTVGVAGGTSGDSYGLTFAAPPGQSLVAGGVYVDAQRAPFRAAGRPGIDISGSGRGCNTQAGHFEVKDLGVGATGAITRLWIVYTQYCEGGTRALWGEVRVGLPTPGAPLVAPGIVRWPAGDVSRPGTVVPVTLVAAQAPVSLGTASITGAAAADFAIRANECSGKSLTLGSSCQLWLRFVPLTAGTRLATLRVADGTGALHEVALQGFAYGGTTRVQMTSDPGDYIGQGKTWSYTIATSEIAMSGGRNYAGFGIDGADGSWWSASFVPGQGDILVAGSTYPNATRYPFNGTGPGLSVTGNGRGCNTLTGSFTVTAADFAPDGRLRSAGISFVQHCEGAAPALRGTWAFRAGDNTPLPPWLIGFVPQTPTVAAFSPPSGAPGTSVTIDGVGLDDATAVTFGGVPALFDIVSASQLQAIVPYAAAPGSIVVMTPTGAVTGPTSFTVTKPPRLPPSALVGNGSFEANLSGWAAWRGTATRFTGGVSGSYAARVSVRGDASRYKLMTSPWPVGPTRAGRTYEADAHVRGQVGGGRICLVLREWGAGPLLTRDARSCLAPSGGWQSFPPLRYRANTSGASLELFLEQAGAEAGDHFDVDAVTLREAEVGGTATVPPEAPPPDERTQPAAVGRAPGSAHLALAL